MKFRKQEIQGVSKYKSLFNLVEEIHKNKMFRL